MENKSKIKDFVLSGNIEMAIQVAASVNFNLDDLFREMLNISTPLISLGGGDSLRGKVENLLRWKILSCSSKKLTTIDLSSITALTNLYCNDNLLTALDLSSNKALDNLW